MSAVSLRELINCVEKMVGVKYSADQMVWVDTRNHLGLALQEYRTALSRAEPPPDHNDFEALQRRQKNRRRKAEPAPLARCDRCGRMGAVGAACYGECGGRCQPEAEPTPAGCSCKLSDIGRWVLEGYPDSMGTNCPVHGRRLLPQPAPTGEPPTQDALKNILGVTELLEGGTPSGLAEHERLVIDMMLSLQKDPSEVKKAAEAVIAHRDTFAAEEVDDEG